MSNFRQKIPGRKESAVQVVGMYLKQNRSVDICARRGLLNYSAIAREIRRSNRGLQQAALIAALRRYTLRVQKKDLLIDEAQKLVSRARQRIRTQMAVVICEKSRQLSRIGELQNRIRDSRDDCSVIEGEESVTIVTNIESLPLLRTSLAATIQKVRAPLTQLTLLFSQKIETTPGVVALVYGTLADAGINIFEEMSCWTEITVLIEEHDLARALQALRFE
jgi:hypothetical protein